MSKRATGILISVVATAVMAMTVTTASARNLSLTNQNIRMTFNNLELGVEGISTLTCRVTLEGSFHARTLPKVAESLVGYLTRVTTGQCNRGVTILTATLPWHIRYVGFSGRLPNITSIIARAVNVAFQVEPGIGIRCLAAGNIEFSSVRVTATGAITGLNVPLQNIALTGAFCPSPGFFQSGSTGEPFLLGTTNRITVTLI
jgi:hypothetical protein